jgi:hypothetical protein
MRGIRRIAPGGSLIRDPTSSTVTAPDLVFPGGRAEYLDRAALRRRYKKALEKAKLRKLRASTR